MGQRVVLVTGASSGFGLDAAVRLARRGCSVFAGVRSSARRDTVQAAAKEGGVTLETVLLDVTDERQIRDGVAQVLGAAGRIDVLVNNAGFGMGGFFEDLSDAELRAQFDTNFFGLAAVTRAVLPAMRQQGGGRVINISSVTGRRASPALSAYTASKFAVEGLSEALRMELSVWGIDVVVIEPGTYKTDIFGRNMQTAARGDDPASPYYAASQRMRKFVERYVQKIGGDPREVGALIAKVATMRRRPRLRYSIGPGVRLQLLVPNAAFQLAARRAMRRLFAAHG